MTEFDIEDTGKIIMDEVEQIPYWELLHKYNREDLKNGKRIKHTFGKTLKEINDAIRKGMVFCDDCGNEMELKMPKNHEELLNFLLQFTNSHSVRNCDNCFLKDVEAGRIIGFGNRWFPTKEEILDEFYKKE